MGLKFLNKKGWHTGSLRNIENVWKAEQKHDAEEKKLEELRKQIQEERERSEFRLLQEQAGLVPRQERLDFLYNSGLAIGKGSSDGFKALEALPKTDNEAAACTSPKQEPVPGALFEEKRQSANDAWRKLHSDPLLMIRQREQEALARVKNNPIQMAMIRKSVEVQKHKKASDEKEPQKNVHQRTSRHQKHSSSKHRSKSEHLSSEGEDRWKPHKNSDKHKGRVDESSDGRNRTKKSHFEYSEHPPSGSTDIKTGKYENKHMSGKHERSRREKCPMEDWAGPDATKEEESRSSRGASLVPRHQPQRKHQNNAPRLSEEERATRLREMLVDAELHEEQRWKRLRQAEEDDAREAMQVCSSGGRNSLEAAHKSLYGADRGGSSTIEKSVRRRAHYLQGKSDVGEGNAFRR